MSQFDNLPDLKLKKNNKNKWPTTTENKPRFYKTGKKRKSYLKLWLCLAFSSPFETCWRLAKPHICEKCHLPYTWWCWPVSAVGLPAGRTRALRALPPPRGRGRGRRVVLRQGWAAGSTHRCCPRLWDPSLGNTRSQERVNRCPLNFGYQQPC